MKKRKIRSTMSVFLTTFLLLQIILLFLYKSFIVDIAKKNEKNLVENTLQIYHNTMESVLERLDDNLDLLLGCRLLLTQLNGENNLEKVKAQHQMLQIRQHGRPRTGAGRGCRKRERRRNRFSA